MAVVDEAHGAVNSRLWRNGELVAQDFPLEQLSQHLSADGALVWVDLCGADDVLLTELAGELALEPLALEDAVAKRERAKAVRYPTHTFLTVYGVQAVAVPDTVGRADSGIEAFPSRLRFTRLSAFVMPRGIVTVRRPGGFDIEAVLQRWDENPHLLRYGVSALLHGLLDVIVDEHFEAVQVLDDAMESLEDGLFDEEPRTIAVHRQTYQVRKDLVELRRVVLPMRELVNVVLRHRHDLDGAHELDPWYDDLYDHVLRAAEWTESLRDMITTVFETNLSLQDARLNAVMKKLTGWAAIIAVPTAITGFFGQNVPFPGFGEQSGVVFSVAAIIGIGLALYVSFRRRDWL